MFALTAAQAVARAQKRFDSTVRAYWRISDELLAHLFEAASTLVRGLEETTPADNQPVTILTEIASKPSKLPH